MPFYVVDVLEKLCKGEHLKRKRNQKRLLLLKKESWIILIIMTVV